MHLVFVPFPVAQDKECGPRDGLGEGRLAYRNVSVCTTPTWTPKVCKIMAFMAIIMGLGLLFYILLGFR